MSEVNVHDLYHELASHRVKQAIGRLSRAPAEQLAAQGAGALEDAAGALACIAALQGPPAARLRAQIAELVWTAAALEQIADSAEDCKNHGSDR